MKGFIGPQTTNFNPDKYEDNKEMKEPNVEEYLKIVEPATEEAREESNKYIEEHFGVFGSEDFKSKEYTAFADAVVTKNIEQLTDKTEDPAVEAVEETAVEVKEDQNEAVVD